MLGVEARRWSYLRRRQLGEHKFRHQALIGPFVADFVYLAARLMVGTFGYPPPARAGTSPTSGEETGSGTKGGPPPPLRAGTSPPSGEEA